MQDFEKLGAFYLGREYDLDTKSLRDDLLLYDSKDLTTHGLCVGMTGSGKTGLCLGLLEEALIDGIPAIAIDPKGDLGNLMLAFPELKPADFRPWIDEGDAMRKGLTPDEFSKQTAKLWKEGLKSWGQDPARIERFKNSAEVAIYTPGGSAGLPLTVLRSFNAPPPALIDDIDAMRERIGGATSGLLALLGIDADPIRSREYILLSNIFDTSWRAGKDLDLPQLIQAIQKPPFDKVGFMELESFYPEKDRFELSISLNNLLASPTFAGWMEGEPLDIQKMLYTPEGKPRLAIMSIAHLSDQERMFFVTILLNEMLSWMRSQPGTNSLRALLYMDEVYGYFPPTKNPPSKGPMLTLLKQARAFGLGVVLATQNPVDLDYKGLSNMGTWFLGRLQTERDKLRVLDGLEGAAAESGGKFDRQQMEATLASLGKRVFLMHNVHEDAPVVFQTRWVLSYLRGPLSRPQIQTLMAPFKEAKSAAPLPAAAARPAPKKLVKAEKPAPKKPLLPKHLPEKFIAAIETPSEEEKLIYRPAVYAVAQLHFVRSTYKVDEWRTVAWLQQLKAKSEKIDWSDPEEIDLETFEFDSEGLPEAEYADLPKTVTTSRNWTKWNTDFKADLYREKVATVWKCTTLKQYSEPGETEAEFRTRLSHLAREERDLEVEKLRKKYASKLSTLEERIRKAEQKVEVERAQFSQSRMQTAISFGSSVLGAMFGRKLASATNVRRAGTSMRSASRSAQQYGDIGRAEEDVADLKREFDELEIELIEESKVIENEFQPDRLEFEALEVRPRKSDIGVETITLAWAPWIIDEKGIARPVW